MVQFVTDKETGRRVMQEVEGSEKYLDAELVLIAAGFLGPKKYIADAFGVETNERSNVATEQGKYSTNVDKVFTAGDMHRGQSFVFFKEVECTQNRTVTGEFTNGFCTTLCFIFYFFYIA